MEPPRSAILNVDVIDDIISYLAPPDLASAALVCHLWKRISERLLYSHIQFSDRTVKLASTLRESDHIRRLIRRLDVYTYGKTYSADHYEWMLLLPQNTIHTMTISNGAWLSGAQPHFMAAAKGCPALRTVRHLYVTVGFFISSRTLQGDMVQQGAKVEDIMQLPNLESLSIKLPNNYIGTSVSGFSLLKRLSIHIKEYTPQMRATMQHLRPSLIRLDIQIGRWDDDVAKMLGADLATFTQLQHLSIIRAARRNDLTEINVPFMDDVITQLTHLETLSCAFDLCTGELISRIPLTLWSLAIESAELYAEEISDACVRKEAGGSSLRLFKVGNPNRALMPWRPDLPINVVDQCRAAGIVLQDLEYEYWSFLFSN